MSELPRANREQGSSRPHPLAAVVRVLGFGIQSHPPALGSIWIGISGSELALEVQTPDRSRDQETQTARCSCRCHASKTPRAAQWRRAPLPAPATRRMELSPSGQAAPQLPACIALSAGPASSGMQARCQTRCIRIELGQGRDCVGNIHQQSSRKGVSKHQAMPAQALPSLINLLVNLSSHRPQDSAPSIGAWRHHESPRTACTPRELGEGSCSHL